MMLNKKIIKHQIECEEEEIPNEKNVGYPMHNIYNWIARPQINVLIQKIGCLLTPSLIQGFGQLHILVAATKDIAVRFSRTEEEEWAETGVAMDFFYGFREDSV